MSNDPDFQTTILEFVQNCVHKHIIYAYTQDTNSISQPSHHKLVVGKAQNRKLGTQFENLNNQVLADFRPIFVLNLYEMLPSWTKVNSSKIYVTSVWILKQSFDPFKNTFRIVFTRPQQSSYQLWFKTVNTAFQMLIMVALCISADFHKLSRNMVNR